ncbi:MAG: hypothetical protein ACPGJV_10370 [Bacteriovoracaceae bacterium]
MKIILSLVLLGVLASCSSLGEKVSGVSKARIAESNLKGKNPVEVKKLLGTPVHEGFFGGDKKSPLYFNQKGFFYALVYSTKESARYAYNLDDGKSCHVFLFYKNNEFKFNSNTDAKRQVSKFCSPGVLTNQYSIKEMSAEKFWEKYGY